MKIKDMIPFIAVLLFAILFTSCLTSEFKEYHYILKEDGSGQGSIIYVNLVSEEDEEKDVSFSDFGELVESYLEGDKFEEENPFLDVTRKELFEKDSVLMGNVSFTFDSIDSIGFFTLDIANSPYMYYMGSISETLVETDGKYLGENRDLPIIVWDADVKEFYIKTQLKDDMSDAHSLLPVYKTWKAQR